MDSITHKITLIFIIISICLCICLCAGCEKSGEATQVSPINLPEGLFINADIKEQIIFDSLGIIIKAISLNMNADSGPVLLISGENTSNISRIVTIKNCSVNNLMVEPEFEMQLNPKGKNMCEAVFSKQYLLTANIETFSSISFVIHIAEANDRSIFIDTDQINIITSMTGIYMQKFDFPGIPLVDSKDVKISVMKKTNAEAVLSKQIYLYIDNSLSEDIIIEAIETYINGIKLESMFFHTVCAGKKSWVCLSFRDCDIVEKGIVDIDELIISFRVFSIFGTIINAEGCKIEFSV